MTVLDLELARLARVTATAYRARSDRNAAVVRRRVGRTRVGRRDHIDALLADVLRTREVPVLVLRAGVGIGPRGEREALADSDMGADDAGGTPGDPVQRAPRTGEACLEPGGRSPRWRRSEGALARAMSGEPQR
jgi:hypothetical protein